MLLYFLQLLFLSQKAIDRFDLVLQQSLIAEFIMRDQVQYPGITLDISPDIVGLLIDDQVEKVNSPVEISTAKIQAGNFIVKYDDPVLIPMVGILIYNVDQFG